jgi:predicted permease
MDDPQDLLGSYQRRQQPTHHASAWGLASLLISCTLLVVFLQSVVYFTYSSRSNFDQFGGSQEGLMPIVSYVLLFGMVGLSLLALLFGIVGLASGFARGQPVGLPTAGLFVSLFLLVLWALVLSSLLGVGSFRMRG